ncbi:MAG: hypothetical protein QXE06_06930 [Candidatus Bathyarchaeia archaeon]
MTIYVCRSCGKFFNSDVLGECPFCHEPVKNYPKTGQVQFRLAVSGAYHIERLSYYTKLPSEWKEWGWIIFADKTVELLRKSLERDPNKVEAWM